MEKKYFLELLYPTPLYSAILDDEEIKSVQEEFQNIHKDIKFVDAPEKWGKTHELSDSENKNQIFLQDAISKFYLVNFQKVLQEHIKNYCRDLGLLTKNSYERTSWFTRFQNGDYGPAHIHGESDISGCYYYQTNGEDGNIYFSCPNPYYGVSGPYANFDEKYAHKPQVGKLLLFPGWLQHGITRNVTDSKRISLSFNIKFKD